MNFFQMSGDNDNNPPCRIYSMSPSSRVDPTEARAKLMCGREGTARKQQEWTLSVGMTEGGLSTFAASWASMEEAMSRG